VASRAGATVIMAVVLVLSSVTAAVSVAGVAAQDNDVVDAHHDLRTDAHVEQFNETGEVTNTASNTRVKVVDESGFVRVHADNPNGYAVRFIVDIPADVAPPAELGDVASVDGADVDADWYVRQDLSTGTHHTRVEMTVPAGSNTTIAPSKPRIMTLAWTGDAQKTGESLLDKVSNSGDLEKNSYTIRKPSNSSTVSVDLENPETGEVVDEHQAMWRDGEDGTWHPVTNDEEDPVYVTEGDGRVEFHFNRDVEVKFTVNPGPLDKTEHAARSYAAGWKVVGDVLDSLPFTVQPTNAVFGGVSA